MRDKIIEELKNCKEQELNKIIEEQNLVIRDLLETGELLLKKCKEQELKIKKLNEENDALDSRLSLVVAIAKRSGSLEVITSDFFEGSDNEN